MRLISLTLSVFALCCSSYSLWLSIGQNRKLLRSKQKLLMENFELHRLCEEYSNEIKKLREENNNETDAL